MQLLVLRQIALPRSMGIAPRSRRTKQDVGAGVGWCRRKAEGRWPAEPISVLLEVRGGVQQLLLSRAGHLLHVSTSLCSL